MAAVGNLNDYVKFQMAQGLEKGDGGGVGGMGAEMAVGMAMAQQMMNQTGGPLGSQATPGIQVPAAAPAAAAPARRRSCSRRRRWRRCSASAKPTSWRASKPGDLKGKKIGTQWRVTKTAVDQFLHS